MKNKAFFILSFLVIAFLVGSSYVPQAAFAEQYPVSQKEDSNLQGNNLMAGKLEFYSVPGIALTPVTHRQTYGYPGGACLRVLDSAYIEEYEFVAPINVPYGAKGATFYGMYRNYVDNPNGSLYFRIYRKRYDDTTTERLVSLEANNLITGHYDASIDFEHEFDTSRYLYFFSVIMPAGGDSGRGICGVQIEYTVDPIFGLGLPVINKP